MTNDTRETISSAAFSRDPSIVPGSQIGFTTGTAAAAAAGLAVSAYLSEKLPTEIDIQVPGDITFKIKPERVRKIAGGAVATVVKKAGDDPDVTNGIVIGALVRSSQKYSLTAGSGIGVVTKPGLALSPGSFAINETPREQIKRAVQDAIDRNCGDASISANFVGSFEVKMFVPRGRRVASRTMNAQLGILGGISIIGTTGIVRPMSVEAHIQSLRARLSIARAAGLKNIVLVPGNIGARAAKANLMISEDGLAEFANYPTDLLKYAVELGFSSVLLFGHTSKLVKIAAGYEHTGHSDTGMASKVMIGWLKERCPDIADERSDLYQQMNTVEEIVISMLQHAEDTVSLKKLAEDCSSSALRSIETVNRRGMVVGTALTDLSGRIIACDEPAGDLMANLNDRRKDRGALP